MSPPDPTPAGFSIRVTSRMTGLSPHTLRMWERRYGFPEPERTSGGARRYSKDDVERLRLVAQALEHGYRPSEVIERSTSELQQLVAEQKQVELQQPMLAGAPPSVDEAISLIQRNQADAFRDMLRRAVAILGPKTFVAAFAHPLMVQLGGQWRAGSVSVHQEHLASEILSTQLRALLAGYEGSGGRPEVLLATLPGETHGLGLLMVALHLALCGGKPRLFGVDMPIDAILEAVRTLQVDIVGISVTRTTVEQAPP
ncbi:MAG: MerR family transcriptional regulator, partial [Myxococcota bacterium]